MNFSLPKIKFPFKKVKNVCTTEQVIHRVDGQDKKLSEVLNSVPITINGKSPIEYIEDDPVFIYFSVVLKQCLDQSGLYYLYPNTSVDVKVTMTSERSADINVQGVLYVSTSASHEIDAETGESRIVVGDIIDIDKNPEYMRSFVQYQMGPRVREALEMLSSDDIQAIFDYFNAQLVNNQNN